MSFLLFPIAKLTIRLPCRLGACHHSWIYMWFFHCVSTT